MTPEQKAKGRLGRARRTLLTHPKLGWMISFAIYFPDVLTGSVPTAATNGKEILWNPEFVCKTPEHELLFILCHEIAHMQLAHTCGRHKALASQYGAQLSNIALDHAVNNYLDDIGLPVPEYAYCDRKYKNWRAEDIARDLYEEQPEGGGDDSGDEDSDGEGSADGSSPSPSQEQGDQQGKRLVDSHDEMANATDEQIKEAQEHLEQAEARSTLQDAMSKAMDEVGDETGKGDSPMQRALNRARAHRGEPQDWKDVLAEFVGQDRSDDYEQTYRKVTRRPIPSLIRKGYEPACKIRVGVVFDTSGSMTGVVPDLLVELEAMSMDGYGMDMVCCDAQSGDIQEFDPQQFIAEDIDLTGGGGSDMRPGFAKLEESSADVLVILTDCFVNWPEEKPSRPVLIIDTDGYESHHPRWKNEAGVTIIRKRS